MKTYRIFFISFVVLLLITSCSVFNPTGNEPVLQPTGEGNTPEPELAPTCVPQPSGPCLTLSPDEPVQITGDIPYTSPFFLNSIAEPFVMLEDEAGFVRRDLEFQFPLAGQIIGPVTVSEDKTLSYSLALPSVPQGTFVDLSNNGIQDLGVQVFAVAYWSNTWGDPFLEARDGKGWSTAYTSAITDPERDNEIIGGTILVWAPDENQVFPSDFGPDEKLFTEDDPVESISAGYNLVNLDSKPFKVYKERYPKLTLLEGAGAVKDYSKLSFSESFTNLFEKASREYPFTAEKRINWEAIYQEFKPTFDRATTNQEFYRALRSFSFKIPDGHVNVSLDRDVFYADYGGGLGLVMDRLSDQRVIVKEVLADYPGAKAGIVNGAEIQTWNGQPVNDAIRAIVPGFGPYSTEHTREQAQVNFLTRMPPDTQVEITFKNPDNSQVKTATLQSVVEYDSLFKTIPGFNQDVIEMPIFGKVLEESGLGYIRINTFSDDYRLMAGLWHRYIQNMIDNEVPGLIIDLRVNSGGSLGMAMDFAGYFFDREIELYENYYYNENSGKFEANGYPTRITPGPLHYQGPIAVLVSSDCVSACEGFAYALQYDQRSMVIGHYPTAGAFGEVGLGQYLLPGDFSMQFPTGRPESPEGKVIIEGQGVLPDKTIPVTLESALGQTDTVLEAAIQALLQKIQ